MVALGWYTNVLKTIHGMWALLIVSFFLPVLIMLLVALGFAFVFFVLIPMMVLLDSLDLISEPLAEVSEILGAAAETGVEKGAEMMLEGKHGWLPRFFLGYYAFFGRIRHPLFWGIPAGLISGLIILSTLVYPMIVKKEVATAEILAKTQQALDQFYQEQGHFPAPIDGHLLLPAGEGSPREPVRDGFDRPLAYQLRTIDPLQSKSDQPEAKEGNLLNALKRKVMEKLTKTDPQDLRSDELVSYTLHSSGYDLNDGTDDICVSFSSPALEALENRKAIKLTNLLKVTSIKRLRCYEP